MSQETEYKPIKYVKMARELCYSQDVIDRLMKTKSEEEASRILYDARQKKK